LKKLGFADAGDYLRWCACNGFARRLEKSEQDRRSELVHALSSGPGWRKLPAAGNQLKIRLRGEAEEIEEQIFSGQLSPRHVVEKEYQPLAKAVARVAGPSFARHQAALRRLFAACRRHDVGLFRYGGRPYAGCPHSGGRRSTFAEALALIAMDAQHWLRAPEEWQPEKGSHFACFRDLVLHLYVKHSLPDFLLGAWFSQDLVEFTFARRVFLQIAAGHSIRTLPIGLCYSKRMSHFFLRAPMGLTVRQALRWGQVRGMGGGDRLARAVAASVLGRDSSNEPFWASVIDWLIKHPIEPAQVGNVIRYLDNQKFGAGNTVRCFRDHRGRVRREPMAIAQPGLTMNGRTPRSLLRDVQRFERQQDAYGRRSEYAWVESGIGSFVHQDVEGDIWTIEELLGDGALLEEGRRMHHCVGSYAEDCLRGGSTIWSMCQLTASGPSHRLTIEVLPSKREIVQARGFANRSPTDLEMAVLKAWARKADLNCRPLTEQPEL
jgi:hypothetical protein